MRISKKTLREKKEPSDLVTCWVYQGDYSNRLGSWKTDNLETAKKELRDEIELYCRDGLKKVYGEILSGGELAPNGFFNPGKTSPKVVYVISNDKDIYADEYVGVNESRRFRGRRLNERKTYSVFADSGRGGRDEYRDFDSEEEAGRFADSLDKRKFKGYQISDPEGDVIASHTFLHGKREVFTYEIHSVDEETEDFDFIRASDAFYDFDECCDAAREAVKNEGEPAIAFVMSGEYEKDGDDGIYGDPQVVYGISNTRSANADEYV